MPASVTVRDRFQGRGLAGDSFRASSNPRLLNSNPRRFFANPRQASDRAVSTSRVIHMLIIKLGTGAGRYLPVTIAGGGWTPRGGGWNSPEKAISRQFDLVKPQLNSNQRGLAGVGGGSFEVFTSEIFLEAPDRTKTHVFADPRFSTPANPRRTLVRIARSRDVTTKVGAS